MKKYKCFLINMFLIFIWLFFFIIGVTVDSSGFRKDLFKLEGNLIDWALALSGIFLTWTWSNILVLCCIASMVGECARVSQSDPRKLPNFQGSVVRGFFIYLTVVTGQIVIVGSIPGPETSVDVGIGQYFRVASFSSFISFIVGYNPLFFKTFANRMGKKVIDAKDNDLDSKKGEDTSESPKD